MVIRVNRIVIGVLLLAVLVLVVLFFSVGNSHYGGPAAGNLNNNPQAPVAMQPTYAPTNAARQEKYAAAPEAQDRMVIKNAVLRIVVNDPQESQGTISKMAEDMGGWIVTSSTAQTKTRSGLTVTQASLTVRVPAERLTDVLQKIKGSAVSVDSETVSGQDVTQAYTDLQSQLTNLEAAEAQLRKIMDSAGKTDDVLAVYRELVQI